MLKVAVIGVGAWGKNLARSFKELGVLSAVCSEHLREEENTWKSIPVCTFEDLLQNKLIDGFVISTPTPSHKLLTEQALKAGKHVFVEKPIAENSKEALELCELAKKCDRTLMVGHLLRYHPCFEIFLKEVKTGAIGDILHISLRRCNFGRFRAYESIVRDFAPHDLSMLHALLGETLDFRQVQSTGPELMPNADQASIFLQAGKVTVDLFLSRIWPIKEQVIIVQGSKGIIIFDDTKPWEEKITKGLYEHVPFDGYQEPALQMQSLIAPQGEPLKIECQHFLDCIKGITSCRTPGKDGALTLQWIEAIGV